jgi:hypothetical protein
MSFDDAKESLPSARGTGATSSMEDISPAGVTHGQQWVSAPTRLKEAPRSQALLRPQLRDAADDGNGRADNGEIGETSRVQASWH